MQDATDNSGNDATLLPSEVNACHSLLLAQAHTLIELQESREQLTQENEELKLTIQKLLLRLSGHRPERVIDDPNQLKINFGDDPAAQDALADAAVEAEKIVQEYTVRREVKKNKQPRQEELPEHLPRYEVVVDVCPNRRSIAKSTVNVS